MRAISPTSVEGENARRAVSPTYQPASGLPNGYTNGPLGDLMPKENHVFSEPNVSSDGHTIPDKLDRSRTPETHIRARAPTPTMAPSITEDQQDQVNEAKDVVYLPGTSPRTDSPLDNLQPSRTRSLATVGQVHLNSTSDSSRDALQTLRSEADMLQKKGVWMKMALAKAIREGLHYSHKEGSPNDSIDDENLEISTHLLTLRQTQARVQVNLLCFMLFLIKAKVVFRLMYSKKFLCYQTH